MAHPLEASEFSNMIIFINSHYPLNYPTTLTIRYGFNIVLTIWFSTCVFFYVRHGEKPPSKKKHDQSLGDPLEILAWPGICTGTTWPPPGPFHQSRSWWSWEDLKSCISWTSARCFSCWEYIILQERKHMFFFTPLLIYGNKSYNDPENYGH